MATIIDGKQISQAIRQEVADEVTLIKKSGVSPKLTVILVGENPASQIYVKNKEKACQAVGIETDTLLFPNAVSTETLISNIHHLNRNPKVHGILVQLPLPKHIPESIIIETIHPRKDVDGFHPINFGKLAAGREDTFIPCTPAGILDLLIRSGHSPEGKHVVIVGRSNIVGKPLGLLLLAKRTGGNATVTLCHSKTIDLSKMIQSGDIVIAAMGYPEFIRGKMVKKNAVVIDVGMNRIPDSGRPSGFRLVGDVYFDEVCKIAEAITPVPGGVGPMTIAHLLKNTIQATKSIIKE